MAVYKQSNMNMLDECVNRLSNAMQKFTVCILTLLAGPTNLPFLQLANDLRDSVLISNLYARLCKMTNKVDDMLYKVDDQQHTVEDIHTILFKLKRSGTLSVSDSLARQEMPLKPELFHGRDDMVEGIAKLLLREETSRVCILGLGGMGKTSVSLVVVELSLIKERFPGGNIIWMPSWVLKRHQQLSSSKLCPFNCRYLETSR